MRCCARARRTRNREELEQAEGTGLGPGLETQKRTWKAEKKVCYIWHGKDTKKPRHRKGAWGYVLESNRRRIYSSTGKLKELQEGVRFVEGFLQKIYTSHNLFYLNPNLYLFKKKEREREKKKGKGNRKRMEGREGGKEGRRQ